MKILVVRHAIAKEREDFHLPDDDLRPLTSQGKKEFKKLSKIYKKLYPDIEEFFSSPLVRAKETASILKEAFKLDYKVIDELRPNSNASDLLKKLKNKKEFIAVVGHEPFLSQFVSVVLTDKNKSVIKLKKGGACLVEINNKEAKLLDLYSPKNLLKLS